jgi:hypothetical protein
VRTPKKTFHNLQATLLTRRWVWLLLAFLVPFLVLIVTHVRLARQVQRQWGELEAKGEPVQVEDPRLLRSADPSALAFVTLIGSLSVDGEELTNKVPIMSKVAPGQAMSCLLDDEMVEAQLQGIWSRLAYDLSRHQAALNEMRTFLQTNTPDANFGENIFLPLQAGAVIPQVKIAADWLSAAVMFNIRSGAVDEGLSDLRLLSRLRRFGGSPCGTEVIRFCAKLDEQYIACIWEVLQSPALRESHLVELASQVAETTNRAQNATPGLALERARLRPLFVQLRSTPDVFACPICSNNTGRAAVVKIARDLVTEPARGVEGLLDRFPKFWYWRFCVSYRAESFAIDAYTDALETLRRLDSSSDLLSALEWNARRVAKRNEAARSLDFVGAEALAEGKINEFATAEIRRSLALAAIALEQYKRAYVRYPASLGDLVPQFCRSVPCDPVDGKPLRYKPLSEGMSLYSVGPDRKDDGGSQEPSALGAWQGPDLVWPKRVGPDVRNRWLQIWADAAKHRQEDEAQRKQFLSTPEGQAFARRYGISTN